MKDIEDFLRENNAVLSVRNHVNKFRISLEVEQKVRFVEVQNISPLGLLRVIRNLMKEFNQ